MKRPFSTLQQFHLNALVLSGPVLSYTGYNGGLVEINGQDFWKETRSFELRPTQWQLRQIQNILGFDLDQYNHSLYGTAFAWHTGTDELFLGRRLPFSWNKERFCKRLANEYGLPDNQPKSALDALNRIKEILCIHSPLPADEIERLKERRIWPYDRQAHTISMDEAEALIAATARSKVLPAVLPAALRR